MGHILEKHKFFVLTVLDKMLICVWSSTILILGHTVLMYNYIKGVPHHVGSLMALLFDFWDLSENLRRMNHFEKLYEG